MDPHPSSIRMLHGILFAAYKLASLPGGLDLQRVPATAPGSPCAMGP
jgi:hypothetical protein